LNRDPQERNRDQRQPKKRSWRSPLAQARTHTHNRTVLVTYGSPPSLPQLIIPILSSGLPSVKIGLPCEEKSSPRFNRCYYYYRKRVLDIFDEKARISCISPHFTPLSNQRTSRHRGSSSTTTTNTRKTAPNAPDVAQVRFRYNSRQHQWQRQPHRPPQARGQDQRPCGRRLDRITCAPIIKSCTNCSAQSPKYARDLSRDDAALTAGLWYETPTSCFPINSPPIAQLWSRTAPF